MKKGKAPIKDNTPEIIAATIARIFRVAYIGIINGYKQDEHFRAKSEHQLRTIDELYKSLNKDDKRKEVGQLGTKEKQALYNIFTKVIAEITKKEDPEDGNTYQYLISQFNIELPKKLQVADEYKTKNKAELVAAVKTINAEIKEDICDTFSKFIETLAYNVYMISAFESKPTSVDDYKIKTALATITISATMQLDGKFLPPVKEVIDFLSEVETEKTKKEKDNVAKAEAAADAANKAAADKSLIAAMSSSSSSSETK